MQIYQKQGMRGFYQGITASATKAVFMNGMFFVINEELKN